MEWYPLLRNVHIATAAITSVLFVTRLALDAWGNTRWRNTPLRWVPHLNDTVLLLAGIGLVIVTGWMPLVHHWLTLKILLLLGYIMAGKLALDVQGTARSRAIAAAAALAQLAGIFFLAFTRPF